MVEYVKGMGKGRIKYFPTATWKVVALSMPSPPNQKCNLNGNNQL